MAIKINNTKNVANNGIKMLVYGASGAGKTTLIRTLPKPIVLSAEAGLLSLNNSDIPYIEIHNLTELYEAYEYVKENIKEYKSIALDSISEIAEVVLASEKEKTKDARQAYGNLSDSMGTLIRAFRDLPLNVYFSAKQERLQDDSGRILYGPSSPGNKTSQNLPYFFDEVFALRQEKDPESGQNIRFLQTVSDGMYVAKDRSGKLDGYEKADLGEIINKCCGVSKENK